jgi:hypothetical protein
MEIYFMAFQAADTECVTHIWRQFFNISNMPGIDLAQYSCQKPSFKTFAMSKKVKSTAKALRKFRKNNKVMLAAIGGAAAGIAISGIFGTEKAKELLDSVEKGITDFGNKMTNRQQPGTAT